MRLFLFFFFFASSFLSFSQVVTVSESILLRNDLSYNIIGEMKGHVLLFREKSDNFEIQAFDQNLQQAWNKEIELDKSRPEVLDIVPGREGFSLIYRFKKKGRLCIKVHQYDPAANLTDSAMIIELENQFFTPNHQVVVSENKNMALVFSIEKINQVRAFMIDLSTTSLVWETAFEIDDFYANRDLREVIADDDGNMYFILEKENRKSKLEEHRFEVFQYGPGATAISKKIFPMKEKLSFDLTFVFDNLNKKLIAAGLYSDENAGKAAGYFYFSASLSSENSGKFVFHEFKPAILSTLLGKEVDENKGLPEILVREVVLRRDGGVLLINERTKIYERQSAGIARSSFDRFNRYIVDYYYDDLFVASINPDGSSHWENILHKKQYSQDDGGVFSSYFLMKTAKDLRLIFNDEIRNENTVSEYIVSYIGEIDRNSVFSTANQDLKIRFRDALQVSNNHIIVPSERRNRLKLVRVVF